jgi:hypothetical protein
MHLAGSAAVPPAGSAGASAVTPESAAGAQTAGAQTATGVTPAGRSISIVAWGLPAAVLAAPLVREPVATRLALPAAAVEPAVKVEPPAGQAVTAMPTAVAVVPAAVVPVPKVEQVSGRYSPMPEKVPAQGLAMARSVAALARLPAETLRWAQRTSERAA